MGECSKVEFNDAESLAIMTGERERQSQEMELIASENYVSAEVRQALGSHLTNKYAEGYPKKRYYAGQEYTDKAETLAIERAKKLFNAKFANVQPLSGAPANFAVFCALLKPGEKMMGMSLAHGGHLTHGSKPSWTSKFWESVQYGINTDTGRLDYEMIRELALKERPNLLVAGFSAYPRTIDWKALKSIADEVGARTMADVAHIAGFVTTGDLENPLDCGFDVVTSTTHKTLRGPRGGLTVTNSEEIAKKIDSAVFPGLQGGPHMNNILAKAVAFYEALQPSFKTYAKQVLKNAQVFADELMKEGVELITGGTENHIILANCVSSFGISGKVAQDTLERAGLSTNRNSIPNETRSPFDPSGMRFGTPAMTTRGFKEEEFRRTVQFIVRTLRAHDKPEVVAGVREEVRQMCRDFPLP